MELNKGGTGTELGKLFFFLLLMCWGQIFSVNFYNCWLGFREAFIRQSYETYNRSARVQVLIISKYFLGLSCSNMVYLCLFLTILVYLSASLSIFVYLGLSRTISDYLGLSRTILDNLGLSGTIWDYLGLSGTVWDHLGLSETICD